MLPVNRPRKNRVRSFPKPMTHRDNCRGLTDRDTSIVPFRFVGEYVHIQRKYSRSPVSLPWLRSVTFGGASIMPQQLRLTLSTGRRTQRQRLEKLTDTRATDPHASVKRHRHDLWTRVPPTHEVFPVRDRGSWRSLVLMSRKLDMCNRYDDLDSSGFHFALRQVDPRGTRFSIPTRRAGWFDVVKNQSIRSYYFHW